MKNVIKIASLVMVVLMVLTIMFTGCSSSTKPDDSQKTTADETTVSETTEDSKTDISKKVAMNMYLLGDKPTDTDEVYVQVNKILEQEINATVNPIFIPWSDTATKYNLIFASNEDFDLVFSADWQDYAQTANKNGFLEMTEDFLKKYAPLTYEEVKPEQWNQTRVNGKIYMAPCTANEVTRLVIVIRGDLRKKYNVPEIKTFDDLIVYFDAIAQNEKNVFAYDCNATDGWQLYDLAFTEKLGIGYVSGATAVGYYSRKVESANVFNIYTLPETLEYYKKAKEWKDKGYWSKDALVAKTSTKDSFLNGKSATYIHNLLTVNMVYTQAMSAHPDWECEVIDILSDLPANTGTVTGNGMSIHATANNPERAMMAIEQLRNNKDLQDLTTYGIEGKHWEANGDTKYKQLPLGAERYPAENACPWGWWTIALRRSPTGGIPNYDVIRQKLNDTAVFHPLQMYNFADESLKTEIANILTTNQKYGNILMFGFAPDVDKTYAEYIDALNKAGIDEVIASVETKASEYLAKFGK